MGQLLGVRSRVEVRLDCEWLEHGKPEATTVQGDLKPRVIDINGRPAVNRDWIVGFTGACRTTVVQWYSKRAAHPVGVRHPEAVARLKRALYFDQEEFERFFVALQDHSRTRAVAADPELHDGHPDDLIPITEAARLLHLPNTGAIRKYLAENAGYFPEPVGSIVGPGGCPLPAFRRADLQAFEGSSREQQTGRRGAKVTLGRSPQVEERVRTAMAAIGAAGGYRRGMGAELAGAHGEPPWAWYRALREARTRLDEEHAHLVAVGAGAHRGQG